MDGHDNPTLDELIERRLPGIRPRTRAAAFGRARPRAFTHEVTGFTRLDDASLRRVRESLDRFPAELRRRAITDELGNPATDADFDTALRARLLRVIDDAVEVARAIQHDRREHPVLDLSGLPTAPHCRDGRLTPAARYVAAHGVAQGVLSIASYEPRTGMAMTNEVWKYPGGGRGGAWREQHVEDFFEGWVRDPGTATLS